MLALICLYHHITTTRRDETVMFVPVEVVLLGVIHALELLLGNLNVHLIVGRHLDCC